MKTTIKYVLAILVAAVMVVGSAVIPPILAQKNDASFLGVVQKDSRTMETYQYKATKYQKMRVLYGAVMHWSMSPITWISEEAGAVERSPDAYMEESAKAAAQMVTVDYADPSADSVMDKKEAKEAAKEQLDLLGKSGAFPSYPQNTADITINMDSINFLKIQDLTVSSETFYFWDVSAYDERRGNAYHIIMDDEKGAVYSVDISYSAGDNVLSGWDNKTSAREKAELFADYHKLSPAEKIDGKSKNSFENMLYATKEPDYQILQAMKTNEWVAYCIMLKPADG